MESKQSNQVVNTLKSKRIEIKQLTEMMLKEMKNEEEFVLQHPQFPGVLKIRRDSMINTVLNIPVAFYGTKYIISDNLHAVFPEHDVKLTEEEMVAYVEELLSCPSVKVFNYIKHLRRKGLKVGNIIEFKDGTKGQVTLPIEISGVNSMFIPLKKDGTLSKHKPRYIYANDEFQVIKEKLK